MHKAVQKKGKTQNKKKQKKDAKQIKNRIVENIYICPLIRK